MENKWDPRFEVLRIKETMLGFANMELQLCLLDHLYFFINILKLMTQEENNRRNGPSSSGWKHQYYRQVGPFSTKRTRGFGIQMGCK